MNYTIQVYQPIKFTDSVKTTVTRSPPAISNFVIFLIFISIIYIFQYFLFKFLDNIPKINFKKNNIKKYRNIFQLEGFVDFIMVIFIILFMYMLTHLNVINICVNFLIQKVLDISNISIKLGIEHWFMFFFISLLVLIPRFLIKLIENFRKNSYNINLYYIIVIILLLIIVFRLFKFAIQEPEINYLKPIIEWFNLPY